MLIFPPSIQPSSRKPVRKHSTRAFPPDVEAPPRKAARTAVPIGCARVSNGQAAAPPTDMMNSPRLIFPPKAVDLIEIGRKRYHTVLTVSEPRLLQKWH